MSDPEVDAACGKRRADTREADDGPQKQRRTLGGRHKCFVIDVSGSMEGGKLAVCKMAVLDEIERAPADTVFTLVSFSEDVHVHSCDQGRAEMRSAIASLDARGGTALFKAVGTAVRTALAKLDSTCESADSLVVTVLTDGDDNRCKYGFRQAEAKAEAKGLIERGGQVMLLQPGIGGDSGLAHKLGVPEAMALSFSNDMHHMRVALHAAHDASEMYYAQPPALRRAGSISFTSLQRADSISSEASIRTNAACISRIPTLIAPEVGAVPRLRRQSSYALLPSILAAKLTGGYEPKLC